jgi:phosphoribosylamine-glycine ligase
MAVTAVADTLIDALEAIYKTIPYIHFDGMHYRKDIGHR